MLKLRVRELNEEPILIRSEDGQLIEIHCLKEKESNLLIGIEADKSFEVFNPNLLRKLKNEDKERYNEIMNML